MNPGTISSRCTGSRSGRGRLWASGRNGAYAFLEETQDLERVVCNGSTGLSSLLARFRGRSRHRAPLSSGTSFPHVFSYSAIFTIVIFLSFFLIKKNKFFIRREKREKPLCRKLDWSRVVEVRSKYPAVSGQDYNIKVKRYLVPHDYICSFYRLIAPCRIFPTDSESLFPVSQPAFQTPDMDPKMVVSIASKARPESRCPSSASLEGDHGV